MEAFWFDYIGIFQLFLKGILIGIVASAPMGPVGILCIQRTLRKGRVYGIVTGAGAAMSDIIYALITGYGMSFVMTFIENERNLFWLKIIGSVMLFIFGLHTLRTDPRRCMRPTSGSRGTLFHNFITSFAVTLTNPLIIFLFIALFAQFTFIVPDNLIGTCVGYAAIVTGAMLWWLGLTYIINRMKQNFGIRGIIGLNRTIGTIVVVVSVFYAISTIFRLQFFY